MKVIKAEINKKPFILGIAETEEEKTKGLSKSPKLKKGAGMLFQYDEPTDVTFNTTDMEYPIDITFLDDGWNIVEKVEVDPGNPGISSSGIKYVLETNPGEIDAGVGSELELSSEEIAGKESSNKNIIIARIGDTSDTEIFRRGGKVITPIEGEVKIKEDLMQVLDDTGKILMNIVGGERIFSRKHTKKVIELVEKLKEGKIEAEELGKYISEVIHTQDTQKPEYVYE